MTFLDALWGSAVAVGLMMLTVWLISVAIRDVSIVDIGWGLGFVLIAWVAFGRSEQSVRCLLIASLTTIWGARLSAYLAMRNLGKGEDYRYAAMRERHGQRFAIVSFFTVFLLQGVVMLIVSLPIQAAMTVEAKMTLGAFDWLGCAVWFVGLMFEAGGDWQLARFKANAENKGRVLDSGFWRYTRHPNYFGDFMIWWGLWLVSLGAGKAWWTVIGPAIMSVFLMKVSGVTLLEKNLKKKPGYESYVRRTNAFFPWFPRAEQAAS